MTVTTFDLQWSSLTLVISVLTLAGIGLLCWLGWRGSGFRTSVGVLELLRLLIVGFAILLLNQPEAIEKYQPDEKPTVAILGDRSLSMTTRDVGFDARSSVPVVERREALQPLIQPETWTALSDRFEVVITPFGEADGGAATDLHAPLQAARQNHPNLRAVLIASDGDWNAGAAPAEAAMQMRMENIPIFSVPIGSQSRLPDLNLLSLDVPSFGISNKAVRIPFTIESSLPRDHVVQVELTGSDGTRQNKQVRLEAMSRTSDAFSWKPTETGDFSLELSVPEHPSETIVDNNQQQAPITIREEQLKVLVIESLPRWEYRFLRNALSRDPGVEMHCLLFHPTLDEVGGGNRDYIAAFPEQFDELSQYDVVFLGDVGLDAEQLTERQCELLKGLVEKQASGLVFIPGFQGNTLSLVDSPLDPLLPVVLDQTQPDGSGSPTPSHFALTELGRRSLLTKLADTPEENIQVWENLPGFQWSAPVRRTKAGSDVLAVHQEVANEYGRLPLLATRTFGAGKVLFMGTDAAWRWRRGVEDRYHYRFWGQVVRWMAYQRNMAKGESMRFFYSPEQPQVRQTVTLNANVMEQSGEPLSRGEVIARIIAPSGRTQSVQLDSSGGQWGAFAGEFRPDEPGEHQIVLRSEQTQGRLEASLFVQGAALEQVGKPARPEVLEELSRITRGEVVQEQNIQGVIETLSVLPEPPVRVRRIQLWSHPLVAGTLVVLLATFWIGRKALGQV